MARKKKPVEQLTIEPVKVELVVETQLEEASISDAVLDTQVQDFPEAAEFDFEFNSQTIKEVDPPTLLVELDQVANQVKIQDEVIKERDQEIEMLNIEHDQNMIELAQTHLPSRYFEAKQSILISAHQGQRKCEVATFNHPLSAYDNALVCSLKRMFWSDAMLASETIIDDKVVLTIEW